MKFARLLDQQLDVLRMILEELQVRPNASGDAVDRILCLFGGLRHGTLHLSHSGIDTGVKQLFFAGEVEIQRSLGNAQPRGDPLHFAGRVAELSKEPGRGLNNRLTPLFAPVGGTGLSVWSRLNGHCGSAK